MTTDFVTTKLVGDQILYQAWQVKQKEGLEDRRVIEKLEIERQYWRWLGISWRIVTHEDVDCDLTKNLHWINERWDIEDASLKPEDIHFLERSLFDCLTASKTEALRLVCMKCDSTFGYEGGTCLSVVRHALARRLWILPLSKLIDPAKPLVGLRRPIC